MKLLICIFALSLLSGCASTSGSTHYSAEDANQQQTSNKASTIAATMLSPVTGYAGGN